MVVTEIDGATVMSLDRAPGAPAPVLAQVAAGEHRATVEAAGYFRQD